MFYWLPQFTHVFHSSHRKINKQTGILHSWITYCWITAAAAGTPQAPGVEQSRQDSDKNTASLPNFGVSTQHYSSLSQTSSTYLVIAAFLTKPTAKLLCQKNGFPLVRRLSTVYLQSQFCFGPI